MPLIKGRIRVSVRSEEMGVEREDREIVRTGTWWAWMGGGGGRVGNSLRLMVFESSVPYMSNLRFLNARKGSDVPIGIIHSA